MANTVSNIRAGARSIIWDQPTLNLDLGLTMEGSTLRIRHGGEELLSEQYGISPVDFVYDGVHASFVGIFREWGSQTSNAILKVLLPGSADSAGSTTKAWQFGEVAGVLASSIAKKLVLHPAKITSVADTSEDIVFYKACPVMVSEVGLNNRGNAGVWAVTFLALVDNSTSAANPLGTWKVNAA